MAFDIGTLRERRAKHEFEFEGEQITFGYRPHLITPELRARWSREVQDQITDESNEGAAQDFDCKLLSEVLVDWNLTAEGQPVPLTYENLLTLPDTLVVRWRQELFEAVGKLHLKKSART